MNEQKTSPILLFKKTTKCQQKIINNKNKQQKYKRQRFFSNIMQTNLNSQKLTTTNFDKFNKQRSFSSDIPQSELEKFQLLHDFKRQNEQQKRRYTRWLKVFFKKFTVI